MSKSIFTKLLITTIFSIVILNSVFITSSHALGDVFSSGKTFLEKGNDIGDTINIPVLQETSDTIYNTLLAIAVMVAIIVAMILGIQFMAASADEKAKVKEALMPFIVGCIVVFGAFTIWKIAVNIGNDAENSVEYKEEINGYGIINNVRTELLKDRDYLDKLSNDEIEQLHSGIQNLAGPFQIQDSEVILKINLEYDERF